MGIEPTYSAWKADILAVESHPQNMVPKARLELARNYFLWILSPVCLPDFTIWAFEMVGRGGFEPPVFLTCLIYSQVPSPLGIPPRIWCHQKESNLQPPDYKSVALPVVLWWHIWLERWDLNPCPHAPKACALPN